MRRMVGAEGVELPLGDHRPRHLVACRALGAFHRGARRRHHAPDRQPARGGITKRRRPGRARAWKACLKEMERTEGIEPTPPVWKLSLGLELHPRGESTISANREDYFFDLAPKSFNLALIFRHRLHGSPVKLQSSSSS